MLPRQFDVVIERDEEGYYVASVPQLPACHTQARSLDEANKGPDAFSRGQSDSARLSSTSPISFAFGAFLACIRYALQVIFLVWNARCFSRMNSGHGGTA